MRRIIKEAHEIVDLSKRYHAAHGFFDGSRFRSSESAESP